jgi:hypothetical protein
LVDAAAWLPPIEVTAAMTPAEVLDALGTRALGLDSADVSERTETFGPNAVRSQPGNRPRVS